MKVLFTRGFKPGRANSLSLTGNVFLEHAGDVEHVGVAVPQLLEVVVLHKVGLELVHPDEVRNVHARLPPAQELPHIPMKAKRRVLEVAKRRRKNDASFKKKRKDGGGGGGGGGGECLVVHVRTSRRI